VSNKLGELAHLLGWGGAGREAENDPIWSTDQLQFIVSVREIRDRITDVYNCCQSNIGCNNVTCTPSGVCVSV
jgi:hypothetical protein